MKRYTYILISLAILFSTSCKRDPLYYETNENIIVKLNVSWAESQLNPNGVSVYVFDHFTGNSVGDPIISNNVSYVEVPLKVGNYDLLIINDTKEDRKSVV